jgi:hypothetical protein
MVQCSITEVERFISEMKNPAKLLRGCTIFHKEEPRDLAYIVARKIISERPDSVYHIVAGVKILLLIWNIVYIRFLPMKTRQDLEEDLVKAYEKARNDIEVLSDKRLQSTELHDSDVIDRIQAIFKCFREYDSIGVTGASKTLHLIHPSFFVMWDGEIRKNYHKLHQNRGHTIDQCYVDFMKQTQQIAKGLLLQRSAEEIWKAYPIHSIEPQLVEVFSEASVKSLPKMIDECNYVRFRLGQDF